MMLWWNRIKKLNRKLMSLEYERDNYKGMFNSMSETCDMHVEYIEKLQTEIKELKGNPPEIIPPPKYKEDLQGEIFQKIFQKGRKAMLLETHPDRGGTREAMEEVEAAFEVLKEIKPVKMQSGIGGYNSGLQQDPFYRERMMAAAQSQPYHPLFHRGYY